jgi:hypothetical protein
MHLLITQKEHILTEDLSMSEKPQLTMRYLADLIERLEERIAILEQKNDNKKTTKKIVVIEDQPIIVKRAK